MHRAVRWTAWAALAVALVVARPAGARGGPPHIQAAPDDSPARRYAQLDRDACEAELTKRQVPFVRVNEARGVLAPVRFTGPVRGITFRTELPASQRPSTPFE